MLFLHWQKLLYVIFCSNQAIAVLHICVQKGQINKTTGAIPCSCFSSLKQSKVVTANKFWARQDAIVGEKKTISWGIYHNVQMLKASFPILLLLFVTEKLNLWLYSTSIPIGTRRQVRKIYNYRKIHKSQYTVLCNHSKWALSIRLA